MGRKKLVDVRATTLKTFYDVAAMMAKANNIPKFYKENINTSTIHFPGTGSEIVIKDLFQYPTDREFDSLGSLEITGSFIDECNQIVEKAQNIVKSRQRYKLDENNIRSKQLLTCNPSKGWVYHKFYLPHKKDELPKHRAFIQALLDDNEHVSDQYEENLLTLDPASIRRLRYGEWEYDDDLLKLFKYQAITDMFTNDYLTPEKGEWESVPPADRYISCDVARFGKDSTIIIVWYNLVAFKTIVKSKLSTTEVADLIKLLSKEHNVPRSQIVIDEDGVGGGVVDQLPRCLGFLNGSKPISGENYQNLKSQCYFKFASYVNLNTVWVRDAEHRDTITQELELVRQHNADKDAKLSVEPKEKIKEILGRSPDFADALMMRARFDLKRYTGETYIE